MKEISKEMGRSYQENVTINQTYKNDFREAGA